MVYIIMLFLALPAHALNKQQVQDLVNGEDAATVLKPRKEKAVEVKQCVSSGQCDPGRVCYRASASDAYGECVKKPQD